jgi:acetate kinase
MKILVINCGSSSIKYQLIQSDTEEAPAKGLLEKIGDEDSALHHEQRGSKITVKGDVADHRVGLQLITSILTDKKTGVIKDLKEIFAVGHRVVHGGDRFVESALITPTVIKTIEEFCDLAPLHNPPNLVGIRAAEEIMPDTPQVAVFDTSFHQTLPEHAYLYAVPYEYYEKYRLRRYGFHGTSHRYVTAAAASLLGIEKDKVNLITCHLGNGCSMAAVKGGRSIDTTMGFTPLEGLVMGTRSGDIDPAIIFYLAEKENLSLDEINDLLNKKSGLLGVSGKSNDMRDILEGTGQGDRRCTLALAIFAYRIKKYIGAYSAILGKLHAVVFTAGIGENAAPVRKLSCEGLEHIGIVLDNEKNAQLKKGGEISADDSPTRILVVPTNEEVMIARDTLELVQQAAQGKTPPKAESNEAKKNPD